MFGSVLETAALPVELPSHIFTAYTRAFRLIERHHVHLLAPYFDFYLYTLDRGIFLHSSAVKSSSGRTRTCDILVNSEALFQLSYRGI